MFYCQKARKLKEYEDLEEQGKLLRLPCKVRDIVYYVADDEKIFYKMSIDYIRIFDGYILYHAKDDEASIEFLEDDIRETVFLSKEEAETALRKLTN